MGMGGGSRRADAVTMTIQPYQRCSGLFPVWRAAPTGAADGMGHRGRSRPRPGFALVELLVVMAIIGTLSGLLLTAVSRVREAARRVQCSNNLKQMGLGVGSYESSRRSFPPGSDQIPSPPLAPTGTQHAWSSFLLPHIEEQSLAATIDYKAPWNAPGRNAAAADIVIPLYVCPSGMLSFKGKQDYGGISGTFIVPTGRRVPLPDALSCGTIVSVTKTGQWGIRPAEVIDGLSSTLLIGEAVDRAINPGLKFDGPDHVSWAWGANRITQNTSFINNPFEPSIRSHHIGGAFAAFADGHCAFLDGMMDPDVLFALCTRNGGESNAPGGN